MSGIAATNAEAVLHASGVAEREGRWIAAKAHAERARELFVELGDVFGVGRCLSTLGGLAFLLGRPEEARAHLKESLGLLLDLGREVEAAAALASLAQVQLATGEYEEAERLARRALVFVGSRADDRDELGNAQVVLGEALLRQGRLDEAEELFAQAERTFARAATASDVRVSRASHGTQCVAWARR